ncbi:hypothetical protein ACFQH5_18205 [Halomonas salifodinae]|uniref:DUF1449 family protein n=1 Tax=Halomonas salifodinae TaxID=438745 RepID=A0ABW2F347_9GAMM
MDVLTQTLLGFPLGVFTLALGLLILYWLLVVLRLAPLELFEHDSLKGDHLASTLVALGFAGVPASVALTVLLAIAGAFTLALELLVLRWLPLGLFRIPVGVVVLWGALALASPLAAAVCHALHRWFHRHAGRRCLLGETVLVSGDCGGDDCTRATLEDDPEHEVRLHGKAGALPRAGERRVLVKYLAGEESYRSVPLNEFEEAHTRVHRLRRGRRPRRAASQ